MLKAHDRLLKYHRGHYLPTNKIVNAEMFKFMEEENDSLMILCRKVQLYKKVIIKNMCT